SWSSRPKARSAARTCGSTSRPSSASSPEGLKSMDTERIGRPNQRSRTRKDLLQAAARLVKQGRKPTVEEVAAEALVSRATAYRYFPSIEALLTEAELDVAVPPPEEVLRD